MISEKLSALLPHPTRVADFSEISSQRTRPPQTKSAALQALVDDFGEIIYVATTSNRVADFSEISSQRHRPPQTKSAALQAPVDDFGEIIYVAQKTVSPSPDIFYKKIRPVEDTLFLDYPRYISVSNDTDRHCEPDDQKAPVAKSDHLN